MLLVDAGNTFFKWQLLGNDQVISCGQFSLQEPQWQRLHHQIKQPLQRIIVSSVAGIEFDQQIIDQCQPFCDAGVEMLSSPVEFLELQNSYSEPERLGIDRWLAMLSLWSELQDGFLLIDCGSAVTVDVVDGDGCHIGGLITPGLQMMRQSLFGGTGRVDPRPSEDSQQSFLANNTFQAVQGGTLYSLVAYIDRIAEEILDGFGDLECVITGGDAEQLQPLLKQQFRIEKGLVFHGLRVYANNSE